MIPSFASLEMLFFGEERWLHSLHNISKYGFILTYFLEQALLFGEVTDYYLDIACKFWLVFHPEGKPLERTVSVRIRSHE